MPTWVALLPVAPEWILLPNVFLVLEDRAAAVGTAALSEFLAGAGQHLQRQPARNIDDRRDGPVPDEIAQRSASVLSKGQFEKESRLNTILRSKIDVP